MGSETLMQPARFAFVCALCQEAAADAQGSFRALARVIQVEYG